jgi:Carboxypeptidase regulatory-like domain
MAEDFLDRLRIATPCSASWEGMSGNDRRRFCAQCDLHVYEISELTRAEVVKLISESEGRVCGRLYQRADGSVITRDCPVGLRALRKRVAARASAVCSAILGISASIFGQTQSAEKKSFPDSPLIKVEQNSLPNQQHAISGVVTDPQGAVIAGAKIIMVDLSSKRELTTDTTEEGKFRFVGFRATSYSLSVESPGFRRYQLPRLKVGAGDAVQIEVSLGVAIMGDLVLLEPQIKTSKGSSITTTITEDMIKRLPIQR